MKKLFYLLLLLSLGFVSCKTQQIAATDSPKKTDLRTIQGGMWVPSELEGMNESEMKILGSKLSAKDIYDVEKPSLKDAVVQFNGGCTAEIISNQGLLLTNHHCGYSAIQAHSSLSHDYLKEGYWAKNPSEELPNPDMVVTFVIRMDNVTDAMLEGTASLSGSALEKALQKNRDKIKKSVPLERDQKATIKSFTNGNAYYLIVTEDYKDIRWVGAPPSSIGKFGADTDNWMWPRHSGDFSLFRIYADKNNHPATYSPDNVPYKPKYALPISVDGVQEDDFTLVFGFPGRTNEYLPSVAIDQIIHKLNPEKIALREASLAIMDKYMRKDQKIKIQYASKFAGIANYWKKWIGETQGLTQTHAVEKKRAMERKFQQIVQEKNLEAYKTIFTDFDRLYKTYGEAAQARDYWIEVIYRNTDLMRLAFRLYQLEDLYHRKGAKAFAEKKEIFVKDKAGFYKDFNLEVDKEIFAKLMHMYDARYATTKITEQERLKRWKEKSEKIYAASKLTTNKGLQELLSGNPEEVFDKLHKDPAYQIGSAYSEKFYKEINPKYYAIKDQLDAVQKTYTKALHEVFPDMRFFPDANSTLRVTYGQVKGYEPKDGVTYLPVSHLSGIMEKYIPGDYEFDVSQKLQDLYASKNYGSYQEDGKLPVNFIGTNHTTGGNSGSPVLDANGNLIGLNFDRVWEGTMSDYYYDTSLCRNIMVDIRYILFVIDKYAGATRLIDEMYLVHPKKK